MPGIGFQTLTIFKMGDQYQVERSFGTLKVLTDFKKPQGFNLTFHPVQADARVFRLSGDFSFSLNMTMCLTMKPLLFLLSPKVLIRDEFIRPARNRDWVFTKFPSII